MQDTRFGNIGLFNLVLFVGLFTTSVSAIPINAVASYQDKKYPIHVACECIFTLYVDGVYVGQGNKDNYDTRYGGISEWNDTKKYYPLISENEPKIIAFNGMGGQYSVFPNGFIMDMNDGKGMDSMHGHGDGHGMDKGMGMGHDMMHGQDKGGWGSGSEGLP